MARERAERDEEQRKAREAAETRVAAERAENERLEREAAKERERLGIQSAGEVDMDDPYLQSIRDYYESQIKGDTREKQMLEDFLKRVRSRGPEFVAAADKFERSM